MRALANADRARERFLQPQEGRRSGLAHGQYMTALIALHDAMDDLDHNGGLARIAALIIKREG